MSETVNTVIKREPYTNVDYNKTFEQCSSFVGRLPWVEFLDEDNAVLLEDGKSVGAVFDVKPIGTEGRSVAYLNQLRTQIKEALQDSFEERD